MAELGQFRPLSAGDSALIIELGGTIDTSLSRRAFSLHSAIMKSPPVGFVASQPTFRSVTVHFDPLVTDPDAMFKAISRLQVSELAASAKDTKKWRIPVCYDEAMSLDLEAVAEQTNLTPKEYARRHAAGDYVVYMLGGFPGYPFIGDLHEELRVPRLRQPRTNVPSGSIAVTGQFTAIYPRATPGGWSIVGRTPIEIFDALKESPALFSPGDRISFISIEQDEFNRILSKTTSGEIDLQTFVESA